MYTITLQVTIWTAKSPAKTGEMEIWEMKKDKFKCVRQAQSTWESVRKLLKSTGVQGFKGAISKAGEAAQGQSTEEAHTEWSLVWDGSSPSYRKAKRKKMQVRLFFRLSLPHWEKWVIVSRGKIGQTHKSCWTLWRGEKGKKESSAITASPCKRSLPPLPLPELPQTVWALPDLNMTWDVKISCKVLMLSQPGRNTRIAPSYREKRAEHITHCTESQLLAHWYMVGMWDLKPHWPSLEQGFFSIKELPACICLNVRVIHSCSIMCKSK